MMGDQEINRALKRVKRSLPIKNSDAGEKTLKIQCALNNAGANKGQLQYGIGAINFKEFLSVTSKLCHALISIPHSDGMFIPVNLILTLEPELVFFHQNPKS